MKNISMAAIVCFLSLSLLGQDIEVTCDQWKADIAFYKSKLKERHANLYHTISPNQFNAKIGELEKNVCSLEDQQVIVGLSEITASIRDGHTYLHPGNQRKWKFKQMPVRLELFDDGLFVIAADEANKNLIGKKLTAIDSTPVEKITPKIRMIGYRENESTAKLSIPRFIIYPEVLKYFGFIESGETINASFASKAGVLEKRLLIPQIASKIKWVGFTESQTDLPLVYRRNKEIYWFELLPEKELLYLQFNSHSEDKNHQFARLTSELISKIDSQKPKKFVIDLRRNLGGNSSLTFPIISVLSHFERTVPDGQIFIIISRATYSASLVFLSEAKRFADPLLLGEPTGVAPNLYTENGYLLTLPNSKVEVSYSSMFFQSAPFENGEWITPDISVRYLSRDYFELRQPILERIYSYKRPEKLIYKIVYDYAAKGQFEKALQAYKNFKADYRNKYVFTQKEMRRTAGRIGRLENLPKALEFNEMLLKLNLKYYPKSATTMVNLAQLYEDLNQKKNALESYKKSQGIIAVDKTISDAFRHRLEDFVAEKIKELNGQKRE